ncbi:MAG: cytochrome c [Gammaproteobacteria bacterium]
MKIPANFFAILLLVSVLSAHAEDAAHGDVLYKIYCTQCHGVEGNGDGINVPAMSVQPRNHRDRGEMSARTDADLFKAVKEGGKSINKSVLMPPWSATLSDHDINALVRYMRQLCCQSGDGLP